MSTRRSLIVARVLWIFPASLLFLTVNQINVAFDLRATLDRGTPARAEVVEVFKTNRVDVTHSYVRLRVPMPSGETVDRQLPMSISLIPKIQGKDSVDVRILPKEDQEIVITDVARPQWRMAAINAGISFFALLLVTVAVWMWNRYLAREGDPAEGKTIEEREERSEERGANA